MAVAVVTTNAMQAFVASPAVGTFNPGNTGTNRCGFVSVSFDDAVAMDITACTIDSIACTACGAESTNSTNNAFARDFYLTETAGLPNTAGTCSISVTVSGTIRDIYVGFFVCSGVNQTTPVRNYQALTNPVTDGSGNVTVTVTLTNSATGQSHSTTNGGQLSNVTSNQTRDGFSTSGGFSGAHDHSTTPAGTVAHTWSGAGAGASVALLGYEINGDIGPAITVQPTTQRCLPDQTVQFSLTASSSGGTLHYQWKANGGNVGADQNTYTTPAATMSDNLTAITCVVTDDNGSVTSGGCYWLVTGAAPIWPDKA